MKYPCECCGYSIEFDYYNIEHVALRFECGDIDFIGNISKKVSNEIYDRSHSKNRVIIAKDYDQSCKYECVGVEHYCILRE